MESTNRDIKPIVPSRSRWRPAVGWALIVIAVVGGVQNLGRGLDAFLTAAWMIALGVGLIRGWSAKHIAITVACFFVIPAVIWFALPSGETKTDFMRIAELNRLGEKASQTRVRVGGEVSNLVRDG